MQIPLFPSYHVPWKHFRVLRAYIQSRCVKRERNFMPIINAWKSPSFLLCIYDSNRNVPARSLWGLLRRNVRWVMHRGKRRALIPQMFMIVLGRACMGEKPSRRLSYDNNLHSHRCCSRTYSVFLNWRDSPFSCLSTSNLFRYRWHCTAKRN